MRSDRWGVAGEAPWLGYRGILARGVRWIRSIHGSDSDRRGGNPRGANVVCQLIGRLIFLAVCVISGGIMGLSRLKSAPGREGPALMRGWAEQQRQERSEIEQRTQGTATPSSSRYSGPRRSVRRPASRAGESIGRFKARRNRDRYARDALDTRRMRMVPARWARGALRTAGERSCGLRDH